MAVVHKPVVARKKPAALSLNSLLNTYYRGLLSPQQQRQQARAQVNTQMQSSLRDLRTTYQTERERTLREQYAQGTFAGLLKGLGAPGSSEAESIRNAYAKAAGLSGAEQRGFISSTTAQQGADVGQANAANAQLAGYAGPDQNPSAGQNADVLNYLSSLPPGTFASEAASKAAGLGASGAQAAGQFGLREQQLGQQLREMQDQYLLNRRDVDLKRPGLYQDAIGNLQTGNRSDIATLINAMYLQNTMGKTQADISGVDPRTGRPTLAARQTMAELAIKQTTAQSQAADRLARQQIARMNAVTSRNNSRITQQKATQAKQAAVAKQTGDYSKVQATYRANAAKWVQSILDIDKKKGRPVTMPPSKQALVNGVYRLYGQALIPYGLTPQQVATWAAQVVNAFPQRYWNPKTYGATKGAGKGGKAPSVAGILGGG